MSSQSGGGGHSLVLPFDVDDPEFARGFEAGRIWQLLSNKGWAPDTDELDGQLFHAANAEMVLRMLEVTGAVMTAEFTDDPTWMELRRG